LRALTGCAVILLGVAVVATLSRGGMVTFVAATAFVLGVRWLREPDHRVAVPRPLVLMPVLALMFAGIALTTFGDVPARETVRDILSTRAISGLEDGPAVSATAPPPPETGAPLEEIGAHPPGSTAEGASKHLRGLTSGLEEMLDQPLGRGLGAAGNWSREPGAGNESTVGVIAAQLGVVGFALFVGFFLTVIASLVASAWRQSGLRSDIPFVLAGAMFGLFIVSWVSESASGLLGNAFYLLFAGWALTLAMPAVERLQFRLAPDASREEEP
jgi:hypothetical protein